MNQSRQNFFARATFSKQQHGDVDVRNQSGLGTNLAHGRTGCDEENIFGKFLYFPEKTLFAIAKAEIDHRVQFRFLERFGQVVLGAEFHCLYNFACITHAGEHDDFHAGLLLTELLQCLQAVDARHQDIEQHKIGLQPFVDALQRFFASRCRFDLVVDYCEQRLDIAQHARFVVYEQDLGRPLHRCFPLLPAAAAGLNGIKNENLQPAPGSLSTQILPPMPWTRRRTMARPNPMPSWFSVPGRRKKSSKTSRWNSAGIPGPVSATLTFTELG